MVQCQERVLQMHFLVLGCLWKTVADLEKVALGGTKKWQKSICMHSVGVHRPTKMRAECTSYHGWAKFSHSGIRMKSMGIFKVSCCRIKNENLNF